MRTKALGVARLGLVLVGGWASAVFVTGASAQTFFLRFNGAPSAIACTATTFTFAPGLTDTWNFPSAATQVQVIGTANSTVIQSDVQPFGTSSGTAPVTGGPAPYTSTPFPYTVSYTLTPQIPGATASGFSFVCASATGTNFTSFNGAPVNAVIPTLNRWGLLILVALLAALSALLLRRRWHGPG